MLQRWAMFTVVFRSSVTIGRRRVTAYRSSNSSASSEPPPELPEEPTTCCMSGCANCVWIEYAENVGKILRDGDGERAAKLILDKVRDPNMKAFLSAELKSRGFRTWHAPIKTVAHASQRYTFTTVLKIHK